MTPMSDGCATGEVRTVLRFTDISADLAARD